MKPARTTASSSASSRPSATNASYRAPSAARARGEVRLLERALVRARVVSERLAQRLGRAPEPGRATRRRRPRPPGPRGRGSRRRAQRRSRGLEGMRQALGEEVPAALRVALQQRREREVRERPIRLARVAELTREREAALEDFGRPIVRADAERRLADVAEDDGDVQRVAGALDDLEALLVERERAVVVALLLVQRGQAVERRGRLHLETLLAGERQRFLEQDTGPLAVAERTDRPAVRGQSRAELRGEPCVPEQGHGLGAELRGSLVVALPERHVCRIGRARCRGAPPARIRARAMSSSSHRRPSLARPWASQKRYRSALKRERRLRTRRPRARTSAPHGGCRARLSSAASQRAASGPAELLPGTTGEVGEVLRVPALRGRGGPRGRPEPLLARTRGSSPASRSGRRCAGRGSCPPVRRAVEVAAADRLPGLERAPARERRTGARTGASPPRSAGRSSTRSRAASVRWRSGASRAPTDQELERALEPGQDLLEAEHLDARRRQLERERQVVEPAQIAATTSVGWKSGRRCALARRRSRPPPPTRTAAPGTPARRRSGAARGSSRGPADRGSATAGRRARARRRGAARGCREGAGAPCRRCARQARPSRRAPGRSSPSRAPDRGPRRARSTRRRRGSRSADFGGRLSGEPRLPRSARARSA